MKTPNPFTRVEIILQHKTNGKAIADDHEECRNAGDKSKTISSRSVVRKFTHTTNPQLTTAKTTRRLWRLVTNGELLWWLCVDPGGKHPEVPSSTPPPVAFRWSSSSPVVVCILTSSISPAAAALLLFLCRRPEEEWFWTSTKHPPPTPETHARA